MIEHLFLHFSELHRIWLYVIIFFAMFIEGEFTLIFAGILVRSRALDLFDSMLIAFVAVLLHDMGYWYIGKRLAQVKDKKIFGINISKLEFLNKRIKKREAFYIIASKFAWGMNRFVLLSAGYAQTKLKTLLKYSFFAAFVWSTSLISLGFMFAEKTRILRKDIKVFVISITVLLVIVFLTENYFKKLISEDNNEEK